MSKKARQANFNQVLQALEASGFEVSAYAGVEGGILVSRAGYAAVIAPGGHGATLAIGAGRVMDGELARLEDRGYQKFMRTSKFEIPATAHDLQAIHQFSEELTQLAGADSLFNQSLGTTSDRYLYDRVKGRAAAIQPAARPWDSAGSH